MASQIPGFALGDPGYQAALAAQQQGLADAATALKAAREQALIQYGDPNLAGQFSDLDPAIRDLIQANTRSGNSILAQLNHARDLANAHAINNLAARGLLRSGGLGVDEINVAQGYGNQLHDAQQQLLGHLSDYLQSYLGQKQSLQGNVNDALEHAYNTYVSNPALYTGVNAPSAPAAPKLAPSRPAPLPNPYTTGQKRFG